MNEASGGDARVYFTGELSVHGVTRATARRTKRGAAEDGGVGRGAIIGEYRKGVRGRGRVRCHSNVE